jgi:hypothetical protein
MKNLLTQNKKMKKSSLPIHNFGITAVKACPFAGECKKACYATMGAYAWSNVKSAYDKRFDITKQDDFVEIMDNEIKRRKISVIRIHDSGDFYNLVYVKKWYEIMKRNPEIKFYAYTKSLLYFIDKQGDYLSDIPKNFTVIFSYGGLLDHLIDREKHAHSVVFSTLDELNNADYVDVSNDDALAITNKKIGLVYHGYKGQSRLDNWSNVNPTKKVG